MFETTDYALEDVLPPEIIAKVRSMKQKSDDPYIVPEGDYPNEACCPIGACFIAAHGPYAYSQDPSTPITPYWPSTQMLLVPELYRIHPDVFDTPLKRDVAVAVIRAFDRRTRSRKKGEKPIDWMAVKVEVVKGVEVEAP